ncbi:MAG TPA: carboxypeptidase-like regulatory domain-containing protein [Mucilaginibacter sp.]|nr:carboxypeptidase-like regulatory domain-containing protein [Mucilaginibacter sp.]
MRKLFLFLILLFPVAVNAQYKITGRILDSADQKPIPGASVFLANSSVGAVTMPDGNFVITNVRGGQYSLLVSLVGYNTYRKTILVNTDISLAPIAIAEKINALKEVSIRPNAEWEHNYELFRKDFLGLSDNAKECKIINPEVLDLQYDKLTNVLTASSPDVIIIENKALGYKIRYMLTNFEADYSQGSVFFSGTAAFETLKAKRADQRRWRKNRLKAYYGSSMHFLRSVSGQDVVSEGFRVLRLIRTPNPDYNGYNNRYIDGVIPAPLTTDEYTKSTNLDGLYDLSFNNCLYVMYKTYKNAATPSDNSAPAFGWVNTTIIFNARDAIFDNNGIFTDPASVSFSGAWGLSRISDLLPVDFEPGLKNN